jgi:GntR family transcriptional regulator
MSSVMPLPKYHQVYLLLREQLHEGQFSNGLPGESRLQQHFGVARVTVRKALERLQIEGLITREAGRGTRPVVQPEVAPLQGGTAIHKPKRAQLSGLLENLVTMGLNTSVQVLDVQHLPAPPDVALALGLATGELVQKATRVRSTAAGPVSHITTYVPQAIAAHFGAAELAQKPILLLMEEAGVEVGRAEQSISAKLADMHIAKHLDVAVGSALLAVRRLIFNTDNQPVQWLHGLYRPDRYEYLMQLSRVGSIDAKVWVSKELSAQFH